MTNATKIRASYYPGSAVWQHLQAETCFSNLNRLRILQGVAPLLRGSATTEDVIREHLWEIDRWVRQVRRLARKRSAGKAVA